MSIANLKKELAHLPQDSSIDIFDKCLVPTYYGLTGSPVKEIIKFCKKHRLDISGNGFHTCTCPK